MKNIRNDLMGCRPQRGTEHRSGQSLYQQAQSACEAGNVETATTLLREHTREVPEHSEGWNDLGTLLHERGEPEEAIRCLAKAILADPENRIAFENLINAYVAAEKYQEAVLLAERWRDAAPQTVEPWIAFARLNLMAGDCFAARDALEKAQSVQPGNPLVRAALNALCAEDAADEQVLHAERDSCL